MLLMRNDPMAAHVAGWIVLVWVAVVSLWYITRVLIPGWRDEGFREIWKHAATVLGIVIVLGGGFAFLLLFAS